MELKDTTSARPGGSWSGNPFNGIESTILGEATLAYWQNSESIQWNWKTAKMVKGLYELGILESIQWNWKLDTTGRTGLTPCFAVESIQWNWKSKCRRWQAWQYYTSNPFNGIESRTTRTWTLQSQQFLNPFNGIESLGLLARRIWAMLWNPFNGIERLCFLLSGAPSIYCARNPFNGIESAVHGYNLKGVGHTIQNPFNGIERSVGWDVEGDDDVGESIQWNWKMLYLHPGIHLMELDEGLTV